MNTSKKRPYVGARIDKEDTKKQTRHVFLSEKTPTTQTHGHRFIYVIGPFRTLKGAQFMKDHGANNPHCQTVSDAERLAKLA